MLVLSGFLVLSLFSWVSAHSVGITYVDWDGLQTCTPSKYSAPSDELQIAAIMKAGLATKEKIKVVGGGLSFSGVQMTQNGHLVSLDNMNKILNVTKLNDGNSLVEVQAGIRLRDLCARLEDLGLAMINLGATATQSLAGGLSTGTHGTGTEIGCLASQIHSFRMVDSHGNIHTASAVENKELFDAGRVGIGALGIISTITLNTVPLWKMKKTTLKYSLNQLLVDLPTLMSQYKRLQWSWTPYTDSASVLIREDVSFETPLSPGGSDGGCWSTTQSTTNCTDVSYKTLTDSEAGYNARSIYTEMEMFIPVESTEAAVRDFISFMDSIRDQHDESIVLSAMVRYVAADDMYLSPVSGRDSSVISFIALGDKEKTADNSEFERYARGLEELCESKYQGRAHWGKANYANATYLKTVGYPSTFEKFNTVRKTMDPSGMFINDYLTQRLLNV
jgi:hypothetical protein